MSQRPLVEEKGKNKSQVQARLTFSIKDVRPKIMESIQPVPLSITLSVRQTYSTQPNRPLTICTYRNPADALDPEYSIYNGYNALDIFIRLQHRGNLDDKNGGNAASNDKSSSETTVATKKPLTPGVFPGPGKRANYARPPHEEDLRDEWNFITIPSLESGEDFEVTKGINIPELIEERKGDDYNLNQNAAVNRERGLPEPGDVYDIYFAGNCHVAWWNWGDVRDGDDVAEQDDIRFKKLVLLTPPTPGKAGVDEYLDTIQELNWLPSYGCWDLPWLDQDGNWIVYLDVEVDRKGWLSLASKDGHENMQEGEEITYEDTEKRKTRIDDIVGKSRFTLTFQ